MTTLDTSVTEGQTGHLADHDALAVLYNTFSTFALTLIDDANAAAARVTLGISDLTSWTNVSGGVGYQNSWVDFGSGLPGAQYRKEGTKVYLGGAIKSGAINTVAFTLPTGYRPPVQRDFSIVAQTNAGAIVVGTVAVLANGNVQIGASAAFGAGGSAFTSLDGPFFFTDA